MTIPKGTEQWECDLIAPSAEPGLTDEHCDAIVKREGDRLRETLRNWVGVDVALETRLMFDRALIRAAYAAGQAHPQGPPREPTEVMLQAARKAWHEYHNSLAAQRSAPTAEAFMWRAMWDAAPAASQAAPAEVAEPCRICGHHHADADPSREPDSSCPPVESWRTPAPAAAAEPCPDGDACPDARKYGAVHPAKAQEPDARKMCECVDNKCFGGVHVICRMYEGRPTPSAPQEPDARGETARGDGLTTKLRNPVYEAHMALRREAADRIEQLQAQHEADAARIAELERREQFMLRDAQRGSIAEAALAQAVSLLRDAPANHSLDGLHWRDKRDAFLAQADERSDKGAKP